MCTINELEKEQIVSLVNKGDILTAWRQAGEVLETIKAYGDGSSEKAGSGDFSRKRCGQE